MTVEPIPTGYTTVTPYLVVADPLALFAFLQNAFAAIEIRRSPLPDGGAFNIETRIGNAMVMLVLARPDHDLRPTALYLYVPDVDGVYEKAIQAGGISLSQPEDQFYGDRCAGIQDPAGKTGGSPNESRRSHRMILVRGLQRRNKPRDEDQFSGPERISRTAVLSATLPERPSSAKRNDAVEPLVVRFRWQIPRLPTSGDACPTAIRSNDHSSARW